MPTLRLVWNHFNGVRVMRGRIPLPVSVTHWESLDPSASRFCLSSTASVSDGFLICHLSVWMTRFSSRYKPRRAANDKPPTPYRLSESSREVLRGGRLTRCGAPLHPRRQRLGESGGHSATTGGIPSNRPPEASRSIPQRRNRADRAENGPPSFGRRGRRSVARQLARLG